MSQNLVFNLTMSMIVLINKKQNHRPDLAIVVLLCKTTIMSTAEVIEQVKDRGKQKFEIKGLVTWNFV